ncbi:hypothetical protein OKW33_001116 [Paraburkholderia atlantica]|uniref:Uncharacterized protein n=2 Tax=Paraburkholderia atlantica TaxID=2654982 RepID=D5W8F4_PARAM|nr:hypothetical protein [Paraburkholderia atlantica]ADG15699.1 hypothetical protein BC1002_1631 [Paraburkholderia atlantica]MBB5503784.1 hypothetical protein [Paraburkholderia atlantica]
MTNERQIGRAMSEEVSSGRNRSALETRGSGPAAQAAQTTTDAAARGVRRIRSIEIVCEVPA